MNVDHYVVHSTAPDAPRQATYGTSAPHNTLSGAMADAVSHIRSGSRVFITVRDEDANILFLLPVVDYPEFNTRVPGFGQEIISAFIDNMDWST